MTDNAKLVRDFCDLMVKRDADTTRPYFAAEAVYQNTGMPATVGVEAIVANLAGQYRDVPRFLRVSSDQPGSRRGCRADRTPGHDPQR